MMQAISEIHSQEKDIFLEVGGSGGVGSVNFEWWTPISRYSYYNSPPIPKVRHILRSGIGFSPFGYNNDWAFMLPLMYQMVYGEYHQSHRIEVGAGFSPGITTKGESFLHFPLSIGYRYWGWQEPIYYRVAYTPIITTFNDFKMQHWGGLTIGYRIGNLY